jgi:hypothetical protein
MENELTVYAGVIALVIFAIVIVILCVASSKNLKKAWQPLANNSDDGGTKQDDPERSKTGIILQSEGIKPNGSGDVSIDASVLVGEAHSAFTTAKQETDLLIAYDRVVGAIACLHAIQRVVKLSQIAAFLPPSIGGVTGLLSKLEVQQTGLLTELRAQIGAPVETPRSSADVPSPPLPLWVPFKREKKYPDAPQDTPITTTAASTPRRGFAVAQYAPSHSTRPLQTRTGTVYPSKRRT